MAYYLAIGNGGTDEEVVLGSPIADQATNEPAIIKIKCSYGGSGNTSVYFLDAPSTISQNYYILTPTDITLAVNGSGLGTISLVHGVNYNDAHEYAIHYDGVDLWLEVDDIETDRVNGVNGQIFGFSKIHPDAITGSLNVYYIEYTRGSALTHRWDANASGGTGVVLYDTVGGNNCSLSSFDGVADSWWVFYDDGGGTPVEYTITLDSGSYILSGNSLTLLSDRTLSLDNGSYSLTGEELNLLLNRTINLSQGLYGSTFDDIGLITSRVLPILSGNYDYEGYDLNLLTGRSLSLAQGNYTYSGQDVSLRYGQEFRLSLEQGSYSLQGSNANLLKDHILKLNTEEYTYTPDNVNILASRLINFDSGSYSYTGSFVNFVYESTGVTYTFSLDTGSYSLVGSSIGLFANRRLPIDFGEYTYEGINPDLAYNRVIALNSGVYTSAGTDTKFKVNRRLVFQNGNYSLQGTPITLSYTGEVLAILERYNLTYKSPPLNTKYSKYNITARYK